MRQFKIGDNLTCYNICHPISERLISFGINKTYSVTSTEPSTSGRSCIQVLNEENNVSIKFTVCPDRNEVSYRTFFRNFGRNLLIERT